MAHPLDDDLRRRLFAFVQRQTTAEDFFAWFFGEAWGRQDVPVALRELIATVELMHAEWTSGDRSTESMFEQLLHELLLVEVDAIAPALDHEPLEMRAMVASGTQSRVIVLTLPPLPELEGECG